MAQDLAYLFSERARILADIESINAQLNYARGNSNPTIINGLEQRLASDNELLSVINEQIQIANTDSALPPVSSGGVVAEEQRARSDDAITQNPPDAPQAVSGFTQDQLNQEVEFGTDGRIRNADELQATPPPGVGESLPFAANNFSPFAVGDDDGFALPPTTSTQTGVAAQRDDNTSPNSNSTAQIINSRFNQRIQPQPNVLDDYVSYTYAISWYLLTPDQYNEMTRSQKKNCASWQLLMQSAGAPTQSARGFAGRNQFFKLDYYIDNLEIDSLVPLAGTGAANTATNIKFKVTEPNGITLIENLYKAVSTLYKQKNVDKNANYPMAQYCLVIRFYGYNQNGELVTTGRRGTNGTTNLTDPRAIVEKFYPFVITNIKFKIPKDRVVEYDIEGKPIPHFYNKSQDRGSIPFAFELIGETVDQVLRGKPVGTVYPSSPGERVDSPSPPGQSGPQQVSTLSTTEQASTAAGTDPNAITDDGMAFGGGGLTG